MNAITPSMPGSRRLGLLLAACLALATLGRAATAQADSAKLSAALAPEGGRLTIEAHGVQPEPAPLFSANADQVVRFGREEILTETMLQLQVVQGRPEVYSLGLAGDGQVVEVTGLGLRDWAVRSRLLVGSPHAAPGSGRFLDLRLEPVATAAAKTIDLIVRARLRQPPVPGTASVLLVTRGDAVRFNSAVELQPGPAVDLRVNSSVGFNPVGAASNPHAPVRFTASGDGEITLQLFPRGAALSPVALADARLEGRVNEATHAVEFKLRGQLRVQSAGARMPFLSGRAALSDTPTGAGWHIELGTSGDDPVYELVGDREGTYPIEVALAAAVAEDGDWRGVAFHLPAGTVVPIRFEGLSDKTEFNPDATVVPQRDGKAWQGFLPANGAVRVAWKQARGTEEGALAFTSSQLTEARIGAGLLRQESQLTLRVLQGKLPAVRLQIEGPGEILGVIGANIVGWSVQPDTIADRRILELRLNRPLEGEFSFVVRSQEALDRFPVRAQPLRLTPVGAVRHSGFVRVANSGAVRLEVADVAGMIQLAPAQYPGHAIEAGARQVFVYRFPAAAYDYRIVASQIQPEIGVSQVVTCEVTETDRVVNADLELDVREAPIRDWSLVIPAAYAVVAVGGSDVADHLVESDVTDGGRRLKILFARPIDGRQLLQVRLERNQPATAGDWQLPTLRFPGAKSVRGYIGAVSTPGYRIVPAATEQLVEVPLSLFPRQTTGLQQAWRVRDAGWTAAVRIEALGQSIQADVFHLYSLKEGVVYGSVLFNYFVVGAPASEWRIAVPSTVGNIDVVGQNVRRDWRREGDQVIVTLHQPVLGASTLLITFEQPMSARGGTIHPGELRPLKVQGERGFLQVVSPLQVKHTINRAAGGLLRLDPLELPAEFRLLTSSPSLAVFQYTARPFDLELGIEWYPQADTVDQVVDFARFSSQVSREGQVVTDARLFVKTRGQKALRLELPEGTSLWDARVDGEVVTARSDQRQTVVPLPARLNPNEPVEVALRLGQKAAQSGRSVTLIAPKANIPVVINDWTVRGDTGRQLVPVGGNAELTRPALTQTGFEWITGRSWTSTGMLLALVALAAVLLRGTSSWHLVIGVVVCGLAAVISGFVGLHALAGQRPNLSELAYAATMAPVSEPVTIRLANVAPWQAMISWWGVAAATVGVVLLVLARLRRATPLAIAGVMFLSDGILAQRAGAAPFFVAFAGVLVLLVMIPGIIRVARTSRRPNGDIPNAGGTAVVSIAGLLVLGALALGSRTGLHAQETDPRAVVEPVALPAAQSILQTWTIRDGRLFAEIDVTVRGVAGDSVRLLRSPAVLTDFKGDGLRISKVPRDGRTDYLVVLDRAGPLAGHARFEMAVPKSPEEITLPTGPAALQRVAIDFDQPGWEFGSACAVQVLAAGTPPANHSAATLTLAPMAGGTILLHPRQRDLATEATQYFTEASTLYVPGPGVVNSYTRVTVRPSQGRVAEIVVNVPAGFTVSDVTDGPVGAWRFDPAIRRLRIPIEPAQSSAFRFRLEMQLATAALPVALALEPLRIPAAADDVGIVALGFGGEAQPEAVQATNLAPVNVEDFDPQLMPRTTDDQPVALVQHAWRYGREGGRVELRVVPVAPEIRVASRHLFSLDDDRLVAALDLDVAITRVGLFKLSFALPPGLEVEALSGPALNHWTETNDSGQRIITLQLNGRTIGEQHFNLTLAGAAPHAQAGWPVPKIQLREATRQTGELLIVPGKGIRLRAVDRQNATQLDPRSIGGVQPGTLAFRLLQADWGLRVGIEQLDPWVTVQALHETTMREGQVLSRLALRYRIENAALKQLRLRLPGLADDQVRTVRASGPAVADMVKVPGEADLWEIHFQRGIVGETDVRIEYQGASSGTQGQPTILTPVFAGTRQSTTFVAVRSGGRLELDTTSLPRGWQRSDWSAVPAVLQDPSERSVPALCFRVSEPEAGLAVAVRRHELAAALKLRVTRGELTTLFSPAGASLTAVDLTVDVIEPSTLRVRLPAGAQLFNTFVNGETVAVVREGDAYLFHVAPNTATDRSAGVRLAYARPAGAPGRIEIVGPSFGVPLANVAWRVVLPTGYDLDSYRGSLRLQDDRSVGVFGVEQYQSMVSSLRSVQARKATALFDEANALVQKGEQQQATEVLSRAAKNSALDQAANEDARVQLRELKTQQAVLGLNTRRQRLYLDHRGDAARNEQLEQAATLNPFMQGKTNFNPQQLDQLLMGNTVEENSALRGIAGRLVEQQLAAEPAPSAIDLTVPQRGRVLTFTRSLQVDGDKPLALALKIRHIQRTSIVAIAGILAALGVITVLVIPRKVGPKL